MKKTASLRGARACATVLCAVLIYLAGLEPFKAVQCAAAVLCGCVLGGIHGAGAAGLYILFCCIQNGFESLFSGEGAACWGLFLGALASGIISGIPSVFERRISSAGTTARVTAGAAAGFALYYLGECIFISGFKEIALSEAVFSIPKLIFTAAVSCALRPVAARLLYPPELAEKELEELMEQLKKKLSSKLNS